MSNTNRIAVITGASSGIGEAIAKTLVSEGYRVALLARRLDRISALADELQNGTIAVQADVTDRDSIVAAAESVKRELGGADILINNAGVMLTAPFGSDRRSEHRQMIETNLLGAMTVTEVFLDQLRAKRGTSSTSLPSRHASLRLASPPIRRRNGASTAGRSRSGSSFSPTSASWSSSRAPWQRSCPTTSPTRTARSRLGSTGTTWRCRLKTSPKWSHSPSVDRSGSHSTKYWSDRQSNPCEAHPR